MRQRQARREELHQIASSTSTSTENHQHHHHLSVFLHWAGVWRLPRADCISFTFPLRWSSFHFLLVTLAALRNINIIIIPAADTSTSTTSTTELCKRIIWTIQLNFVVLVDLVHDGDIDPPSTEQHSGNIFIRSPGLEGPACLWPWRSWCSGLSASPRKHTPHFDDLTLTCHPPGTFAHSTKHFTGSARDQTSTTSMLPTTMRIYAARLRARMRMSCR